MIYVSSSQTVSVKIAMLSNPLIGAYSKVHIKLVKTTKINMMNIKSFNYQFLIHSTYMYLNYLINNLFNNRLFIKYLSIQLIFQLTHLALMQICY